MNEKRDNGKCSCGKDLVPVYWGYPAGRIRGESTLEPAKRSEIILGGCTVTDNDPKYGCPHCWEKEEKKRWEGILKDSLQSND